MDRPKRSNAGSKMARLLNEEEEDEFYTQVYGGFQEEQDDNSYKSESSDSDRVDSDFDADENQMKEQSDDDNEDEPRKKRLRRVVTKAYVEPSKKDKEVKVKKPKTESKIASNEPEVIEKKTLRNSTQAKTEAILQKEQDYKEKMLKEIAQRKNVPEVRRLTQEELLEEAKITEEINTRSLAQYQRLELEKKKARTQKSKAKVPMIRFDSVTVPLFDETKPDAEEDDMTKEMRSLSAPGETRCARTFITFQDENSFNAAFPHFRPANALINGSVNPSATAPPTKSNRVADKLCAISGLKAKYLDPLTKTPYANLAAFRVLRKLYALHKKTGAKPIDLVRRYRRGEINITEFD